MTSLLSCVQLASLALQGQRWLNDDFLLFICASAPLIDAIDVNGCVELTAPALIRFVESSLHLRRIKICEKIPNRNVSGDVIATLKAMKPGLSVNGERL